MDCSVELVLAELAHQIGLLEGSAEGQAGAERVAIAIATDCCLPSCQKGRCPQREAALGAAGHQMQLSRVLHYLKLL